MWSSRSGSQHGMVECPPGLQRAFISTRIGVFGREINCFLDAGHEDGDGQVSGILLVGQILNCGTTRNGANTDSAIGSGAFVTSCRILGCCQLVKVSKSEVSWRRSEFYLNFETQTSESWRTEIQSMY